MSKKNQNDFPFADVCAEAEQQVKAGHVVHQKFTCAGCGQRLTIEAPNTFHTHGTCDRCDVLTDIEKQGCNYLLIKRAPLMKQHTAGGVN